MRSPISLLLSRPSFICLDCLILRRSISQNQWQDGLSHYYYYGEMQRAGVPPLLDSKSIPSILKACARLPCLKRGSSIHAAVVKCGFGSCTSVTNSIISFYNKCGVVDSARNVFDCMVRDSVSWNVMIHGYLGEGAHEDGLNLFVQARAVVGFEPNVSTFVLVLQACWRLGVAHEEGMHVHGLIIRNGIFADLSVRNSLLSMYAKSHEVDAAQRLFDEFFDRDVISWSVMIGGYAQNGEAEVALWLFREMSIGGRVHPDGLTVVSVLQACGGLGDVEQGRLIHGHVIGKGFEADVFVGNSVVDMYSKCLDVDSAYKAFKELSHRSTVSWNSMLSGFVRNERYLEALALFDSMKTVGISADEVTVVNLLQSCKSLGRAVWCECIHGVVIRRCFEWNVLILNTLLDAYAKCSLVDLAANLFERMEKKNLVSWSTMISGYARCGMPDEAVAHFGEMMLANEKPNSVTMLGLLEACSVSAEMKLSKSAHGIAVRNALAKESTVGTALVDAYAKCGEIDMSRKVFHEMPEKNVVSWSAMIGGYGMNGRANEALALLHEMESSGNAKPNKVTMLSVLSACSHGGLLEEGFSCFRGMPSRHLLEPAPEHYSCVVDMLGRAGDINGAIEVIERMPEEGVEAGAGAWGALLSACRSHANCEVGERALSRVVELEPSSSSGYLLASNMYAMGGSRGDTARMRSMMRERGVRVVSGYSLVHVHRRAHKFVAGVGSSHPQFKEICSTVEQLHSCMGCERKDVLHSVW